MVPEGGIVVGERGGCVEEEGGWLVRCVGSVQSWRGNVVDGLEGHGEAVV